MLKAVRRLRRGGVRERRPPRGLTRRVAVTAAAGVAVLVVALVVATQVATRPKSRSSAAGGSAAPATGSTSGVPGGRAALNQVSASPQPSGPKAKKPASSAAPNGWSRSSCAPYPSFPDAGCTGPTGPLKPYTGSMTISQRGQVIQDVEIRTDQIQVNADNVTFRNCRIIYTGGLDASPTLVEANSHTGLLFDHCEIDGKDKTARGIHGGDFFTVRNCNIHDTGNGVEADANFTVAESYIWNIYTPNGQDWHSDGVQGWGDAKNVTVDHNTILLTGGETGAVNMVGTGDPTYTESNILVQHNLLAGGGYTIYLGASTNTNVRVVNNHLSTRYSPKVGGYNIWYPDFMGTIVRTGNVIHETGAPANDNLP
jgi:Right handed beta helix region